LNPLIIIFINISTRIALNGVQEKKMKILDPGLKKKTQGNSYYSD
jgi:hypothetical protein